jgi:hypothetical protein
MGFNLPEQIIQVGLQIEPSAPQRCAVSSRFMVPEIRIAGINEVAGLCFSWYRYHVRSSHRIASYRPATAQAVLFRSHKQQLHPSHR